MLMLTDVSIHTPIPNGAYNLLIACVDVEEIGFQYIIGFEDFGWNEI